ncbi:MAG: type II CAAX endopeptidase family protein [Phycisphaerae bacterium]|nr:type II CAAX endopeptidase family protein [Phycisphaerae bacterium]
MDSPLPPELPPPIAIDPRSIPWARALRAALYRPMHLLGISRDRARSGAILTALLLIVTLLASPFVVTILLTAAGLVPFDEHGRPVGSMATVGIADKAVGSFSALLLLFGLARRWKINVEEFGVTGRRLGLQFALIAPTFLMCYFVMIASGVLLLPFMGNEQEMMEQAQKRIEFMEEIQTPVWWQSALLMLFVATHEEVLFRALLIPFLRRAGLGWFGAILCSSLLFGLAHVPGQGWLAMLQTGGLGLMFGVVFVLSRSLPTVIGAHALFNFVQLLLVPLFADQIDFESLNSPDSQPAPSELPPDVV